MQVTVTLTSYGDGVGPFTIYYGYLPSTDTVIQTGVTIELLLLGYLVTTPDGIDYIKVCNEDPYSGQNCEYLYYVQPSPTPSPTKTPSTSVTPSITVTVTPSATPSRSAVSYTHLTLPTKRIV